MYKCKNTLVYGLLFASMVVLPVTGFSDTTSSMSDSRTSVMPDSRHDSTPPPVIPQRPTDPDMPKHQSCESATESTTLLSTSAAMLAWHGWGGRGWGGRGWYGGHGWYGRGYGYGYGYRPYYYGYRPYYYYPYSYNYYPYYYY